MSYEPPQLDNDSAVNPFGAAPAEDHLSPSVERTAPLTQASQSTLSASERMRRLEAKEAEIRAREEDCKRREKYVKKFSIKNWPRCYPILYHSIDHEIPQQHQKLCKQFYYAWILHIVVFALSLCSVIGAWVDRETCESCGSSVFLAVVFLLLVPYLSWKLWYRGIYNILKRDSRSLSAWGPWLFHSVVFLGFMIFTSIGIPGMGTTGLIFMSSSMSKVKTFTNILMISTFCLQVFFDIFYSFSFLRAYRIYRGKGYIAEYDPERAVTAAV
ncbi:MAG: hypothetical protein MHM6MM_000334 [Cercozoa sp. M6MM]